MTILKGVYKTVNRRITNKAMANRKRTNNNLQNTRH
jgi:hypothetical protein